MEYNELIIPLLRDTVNTFLYCIAHDRYVFDKEIEVTLESFEGEDFIIRMLGCKQHPKSLRRYYMWYN